MGADASFTKSMAATCAGLGAKKKASRPALRVAAQAVERIDAVALGQRDLAHVVAVKGWSFSISSTAANGSVDIHAA